MNFQYQRPTCVCGLNVCTTLPPLMSYRTHVESSWPVTKSRPEGSTVHAATGELQGMTFTQPRVRRSQKRAVLSYEDENAYVNYPFTKNTGTAVVPFRLAAIRGSQGTSHISFTLHSAPSPGTPRRGRPRPRPRY